MKTASHIARILLGLIFTVFGLNGFLHFIPLPFPADVAGQFMGALFVSHYYVAVFAVQVAGGILLLSNRFVPLALTLLGPGRRVVAFKADLSNRTEIDRLVSAAFGHFGSIDILVNNAGVEKKAPFWAVTEEGGDSRFERPAGRVMAVGNPPVPALWPIWRVLIGGPVLQQIRFASPNHLRSIRAHRNACMRLR